MKHTLCCFIFAMSLGGAQAQTTVVHAGRLLDGSGAALQERMSITIERGRIVSVDSGFVTPPGARIVDLTQATVLPGLIDSHIHPGGGPPPSGPPSGPPGSAGVAAPTTAPPPNPMLGRFGRTVLDQALSAVPTMRALLDHGFTSARVVGAAGGVDLALKRAINEGTIAGPRLWVALEPISPSGGHSDQRNGLDPALQHPLWDPHVADGADAITRLVREHKRRGADLIKIMPRGGVSTVGNDPRLQLMDNAEIKAAVDAAHALGLKVAAHAHGKAAIDNAIRLGVDSIEHGSYGDAETHALYRQHGTWLVPTLSVALVSADRARTNPGSMHPESVAKALMTGEHTLRNLQGAYKAGVKIAFGTDVGPAESPLEFAQLVKAGLTPMDAILSATRNAAELLGALDQLGTVQKGRHADLIAVAGNPLADITELERVRFVMKGGEVIKDAWASARR